MNTFPIDEKIQNWLDALSSSVPLRAVSFGSSSSEGVRLKEMIADSGLSSDSLVTAMLWIRVGIIEPAHERLSKLADQAPSHAAAMERIAWIEWESLWQLV